MISNNNLEFLDLITIISFILQVQNNEELEKQTSNDQILQKLHHDVMMAIEDNRKLCDKIMKQNEEIIALLKGK